jgi:nitroreductase
MGLIRRSRALNDSVNAFRSWREILEVARHAPSPHNVQPWKVRLLSPAEAELLIDGRRTLPKEDFTGAFLISAMGMFLEAIDLLARPRGLRLEWRLLKTPAWLAAQARADHTEGLLPFAHLCLTETEPRDSEYPERIFFERRTCRTPLRATPVPAEAVRRLAELAQAWGHRYTQIDDPDRIERILDCNIDAVFHDLNVAGYHDELTSWFRFTNGSAARHRDGLDWRCMNVSRTEFWLSARVSRLLLFPPTRALLRERYRRQLATVPAVGILSGDFFAAEYAVDSGRFLLRFWLETARLGLYLHPYGNLVTNAEAAEWLRGETGIDRAWLVFKLGYADAPPKSHRRHLQDILIS